MLAPMTEAEFEARSSEALDQIERALEESGLDADFERTGDGVLEVEFANGSKLIINRHAVAREMWVASRGGGFHFRWDGARWRDTRDGTILFTVLSRPVSSKSGTPTMLPGAL